MSGERDMQIDVLHALEDFLDAYDNRAEMVVTEAIANAIDVKAGRIAVELEVDFDDDKTISFHNDGPPMTAKQFKDYHVIARSSKSKGMGIGFAGIGAKVYLAAWDKAVIRTETTDGKAGLGSDMYVRGRTLKWKRVPVELKKRGTLYRVTLQPADYAYLERNATRLISDVFDPAIVNGLEITLDGKRIKPWSPKRELSKTFTVSVKSKKFCITLSVTEEDVPAYKTHVQYHVSGKVISTKKPDWMPEVKPEYSKRIHAYVDATAISDKLNLTKTGFKRGAGFPLKDVEGRIYEVLRKSGYIGNDDAKKSERTRLTKFFEKLFKNPKYAFLNPEARGGRGPGSGPGSEGTRSKTKRTNQSSTGNGGGGERDKRRQGGGSLQIVPVYRPEDEREGWLDPSTNRVVVNFEHPLFVKYANNLPARNQRIATILTSVLIKNAATKKPMDARAALDLQNELLTMSRDEVW